jgi:hypothetical protein
MKINYRRSETVPINMGVQEISDFVENFGCYMGNFPIKYLGIPLHYEKLRRGRIDPTFFFSANGSTRLVHTGPSTSPFL